MMMMQQLHEGTQRNSPRPRLIYQYTNVAMRLSGQNCNFLNVLNMSLSFQKTLEYKENNSKYGRLPRKPGSQNINILKMA